MTKPNPNPRKAQRPSRGPKVCDCGRPFVSDPKEWCEQPLAHQQRKPWESKIQDVK